MLRCSAIFLAAATFVAAQSHKYSVGSPPSPEEMRNLGPSIGPNGDGLPAGSGSAVVGRGVYSAKCASCHGDKGQGGTGGPALAGGMGTLTTPKPLKTVGSYWPYATTLWDYTNRAMPFYQPRQLAPDDVYAVVAYVLFINGIVGENQMMDAKSLPKVRMPNRDGFVADSRPDVGKH